MSSQDVIKSVSKKLKYYFEVKRLEDGFDLTGPDCPKLDHPRLRARPTLMYDGLHDRPLKHYFSRDEVRTALTQFKTPDESGEKKKQKSSKKGDSGGREGNIKKLLENYMKQYNYVDRPPPPKNSGLNAAYYNQNKKGGRRLKGDMVGYGIPLQKKRSPHRGGYPVLRSVPTQYASKAEAHRLVNMASKLLLATETIDLDENQKDGQNQKQRPKSAPQSQQSRKQDKLPALKNRQRPQTSKSRREHKIYTVDPSGKKVFIKYHDKEGRRGEDQPDSAYSTRPGSTSPTPTNTTEADSDQEIKPWLRREMRRASNRDDEDWVRTGSPIEPHPPPKHHRDPAHRSHVVVEQVSPRSRSRSASSSSDSDHDHKYERNTGRDNTSDNRTTQTGGELLRDYDPSEKVIHDGRLIKYRIHVYTGDKLGAGTRADIKVVLIGDKGRTEEITLAKSRNHKVMFQKGQEDIFDIESYFVGPLRKIFIGHDRKEMGTDWYLDRVVVKDMQHHFQYLVTMDTWLSHRSDDKLTFKGFNVRSSSKFSQNEEEDRDRDYGNQQDTHIAIVHTNPRVEQVDPGDERTLRTEPSGSPRGTSTHTQYSEPDPPSTTDDGDTSTTYTTSDVPSSTRYRPKSTLPTQQAGNKKITRYSPRTPPMKRSDNFFDQNVKEKDYSSVIESLSVTTEQDNRDDSEFEYRAPTRQDHRDQGMTLKPVNKENYEDASPVRADTSDSDDEFTVKVQPELTNKEKIFTAASSGDLDTMKRLLDDEPGLKTDTNEQGWSILHVAAFGGHGEMIQWLTLQVTDLEIETPTGSTPLHVAAMGGHVPCMRVLFAMGASVNSKNYAGATPLHMAAEHGQLEAVKYLVANRADLELRDVSGNSAHDMASASHHQEATACATYLQQCEEEQSKPNSKLAEMRSSSEVVRPTSARSESSIDSSSSSSSSSSSNSNRSSSSEEQQQSDKEDEMDEKQKKKHDDEIMEKRRLYKEQQEKMSGGRISFMDSIRQDVQ